MPLVESKRFFSRPITIYAVLQMSAYLIIFYNLYALNKTVMSGPWWRVSTLIVIVAGLYSALSPALLREENKAIRMNNDSNPIYFVPVAAVLMGVVYLLAKSYYFWSFEITHQDLTVGLLGYLLVVPVLSMIIHLSEKDL